MIKECHLVASSRKKTCEEAAYSPRANNCDFQAIVLLHFDFHGLATSFVFAIR